MIRQMSSTSPSAAAEFADRMLEREQSEDGSATVGTQVAEEPSSGAPWIRKGAVLPHGTRLRIVYRKYKIEDRGRVEDGALVCRRRRLRCALPGRVQRDPQENGAGSEHRRMAPHPSHDRRRVEAHQLAQEVLKEKHMRYSVSYDLIAGKGLRDAVGCASRTVGE